MNLPENWDKAESAYNKHYDPYDDGPEQILVKCPSCDTDVDEDDLLECGVHDVIYCYWCACDSKGTHKDESCRTNKAIGVPF